MDNAKKSTITSLVIVGILSISIIVAFSVPLGIIPPIGDFLLPGDGVWELPDEVASEEVLTLSELSADVTVYRDQWGIPHIYGYNQCDILFALGYVHAQDRLFQMDMARRLTSGSMSEILGSGSIEQDKFNLNMMKKYWVEETYNVLIESDDPFDIELLQMLNAYSNGINYFIDHNKGLPLEFLFLDYKPNYWTPLDTFGFIKYMSDMLTWSYEDFATLMIHGAIGKENFSELFDYPFPYQIPICPGYGEFSDISIANSLKNEEIVISNENTIDPEVTNLIATLFEEILKLPSEQERFSNSDFIGSNNWVVDGSKTATGKPILCNDMHLGFDLPGIWYESHLVDISEGSDFNIYGFFLAGVPYPIVGHNNYVGWGMTNTAYDVHDWYYYEGINTTHYWYKGQETAYETVNYQIEVKNSEPIDYTIKLTVHGPVFTNIIPEDSIPDLASKVIACKWIGQSITYEGRAIFKFAHSKNRADFDEASRDFSTPAQNLIYGDIHGNIGIRPTGKVPIRDDSSIPNWHLGNGSMPYNGSAGEGEWIGFVPFEDLPHSENPSQGYLASANQVVAGPDYLLNYTLQGPLSISSGYRARRINNVLTTSNELTINDMKNLQLDVYSIIAGNFTPYLLNAIQSLPSLTTLQEEACNVLFDWNFIMDKTKTAPTIFNAFLQMFEFQTFGDEFEAANITWYPMYNVLEKLVRTNPSSEWFDNITTPEIEKMDDIMLLSFDLTIEALARYYQSDNVNAWIWGNLHLAYFPHLTGFSSLSYGPIPVDGTGITVMPFNLRSLWQDGKIHQSIGSSGASERLIVDFSNLNNSLSIIPSGQRGISNSKHYTDQLLMYLAGEYHTQYFGSDTITKFKSEWIESVIYFISGGI